MYPKDIASRSHTGGWPTVTVQQVGDRGPYRIDVAEKAGFDTTFATEDQAKAEADSRLAKAGHVCDHACSDWMAAK